jgi:hypothetical protein
MPETEEAADTMIELNAGSRPYAASPRTSESNLRTQVSTSLWALVLTAGTCALTGACYLLFSGWRLLRWLRILPNDGQPTSDLFDTRD